MINPSRIISVPVRALHNACAAASDTYAIKHAATIYNRRALCLLQVLLLSLDQKSGKERRWCCQRERLLRFIRRPVLRNWRVQVSNRPPKLASTGQ